MRDQDTLDEIQKDIRRTRSELQYFIEGIVPGNRGMGAAKRYMQSSNCTFEEVIDYVRNVQADTKHIDATKQILDDFIETHADVMRRILFIYAKLNPGLMYTQGMNEVLAVIYYCFVGPYLATDTKTELADYNPSPHQDSEMDAIEADMFCAFSNVMIDLRDGFLRELDHERSGLDGHIQDYC